MREEKLRRYFLKEVPISCLVQDLQDTVKHVDPIESTVAIEDMQQSFLLERKHVIELCDAALAHTLPSKSLTILAFALIASDHFEWDDDILSEVLWDWSCPEINLPLEEETLRMHRAWLTGDANPPPRKTYSSSPSDRLVVRRRKVSTRASQPD